jgi:hypothetical protein
LIVRHTKSYRDLKNVFFLSRRFHSVVIWFLLWECPLSETWIEGM